MDHRLKIAGSATPDPGVQFRSHACGQNLRAPATGQLKLTFR